MRRRRWLSTLASLMLASSTVAGCRWLSPPLQRSPHQELPPRFTPGANPPAPYAAADDSFTTTEWDGLGQYLSKGTLRIPITIDRYYGPTDADGRLLHPEQIRTAYLSVRLWDVDSTVGGNERLPEVLRVSLNGEPLEPELTGLSNQWTTFTLPLPVEAIRFPTSHSPVVPSQNWVELELDAQNESPGWKVWVDWVRLTVTGVRPWVLVHGFLSDRTTWRYWTEEFAPSRGIPVHAFSLADNAGSMWLHGPEIAAELERAKAGFGVQRLHLVGSSKGGPDGRIAVAIAGEDVERFVMIGGPHHGSELADLVKIGAILYPWLGPVTLIGEPALTELTTWYSRLATGRIPRNMETDYSSIATVWLRGINPLLPGPDDGVVSAASAEAVPYAPSLGRPEGFHLDNPRNEQIFALTADHLSGSPAGAFYPASRAEELSPTNGTEAPQVAAVIQEQLVAHEVRSWALPVEEGRPTTFVLFWRGGEPALSLRSPSGEQVEGASVRSEAEAGLTYQLIHVDAPAGGKWTATVENGAAESFILLATAVDSPVRLAAEVAAPTPGAAGMITARVSQAGAQPPTRLQAWIAYPNGRVESMDLVTDGRPDATSGDLLFSAPYLPPADAYGDIPIVVGAEMAGAVRYILTGVTLPHPTARIAWQSVAGRGGGLEAAAKLEGFPAGSYQIITSVAAGKEESVLAGHALVQAAPSGSETTFQWRLPEDAANLQLGALYAFDADGRLIASGDPLTVPSRIGAPAPQRLRVLAVGAPVRTGASASFPVTFTAPAAGRMVLNARLTDGKGRLIGWASVTRKARKGKQTWHLPFLKAGDGPLYLWDLSLYMEGRPSSADLIPLAYVDTAPAP